MKNTPSLRTRLTLIILVPLMLIAAIVGYWAYSTAKISAQDRFDRSLLSTALAISRDVALSGGDALSLQTRDLIADTSGGPVFYHVYAPDGVFVTGYATPPVHDAIAPRDEGQTFFEAVYLGEPVRVLRLRDAMQIDGLSGDFTVSVWQATEIRDALVRDRVMQSFIVISTLIASVALVVWFGVGLGLRPLNDLENAISQRSSDELSPIQRKVPSEVRGIVGTLNSLLGQVSDVMETKNAFISNAAHQLRNPLAGVLAMAEAVRSAPDEAALRDRANHLVGAARAARDLANQMLTLERANAPGGSDSFEPIDLVELSRSVVQKVAGEDPPPRAEISFESTLPRARVQGDGLMIREAMSNLIDNALVHGGPDLTQVSIHVLDAGKAFTLRIEDDGVGIAKNDLERARERFGQVAPGSGSGLGLPIAEAVAKRHGGQLTLGGGSSGVQVTLSFAKDATERAHPPAKV